MIGLFKAFKPFRRLVPLKTTNGGFNQNLMTASHD
jgi:hypothetical protein